MDLPGHCTCAQQASRKLPAGTKSVSTYEQIAAVATIIHIFKFSHLGAKCADCGRQRSLTGSGAP